MSHKVNGFFIAVISLVPLTAGAKSFPVHPRVPFVLVESVGHADTNVRFVAQGSMLSVAFRDDGLTLRGGGKAIDVHFEGTEGTTVIAGAPDGGTANFFEGRTPDQWRSNLRILRSICYPNLWPGIDLHYRSESDSLEAVYEVAPGGRIEQIGLRYNGSTQIGPDGILYIWGGDGEFTESKPVLYQLIGGHRSEVPGGYRRGADGVIGFWASHYDTRKPLIIDPTLTFGGYFGGTGEDNISAVVIDNQNNTIVTGWTTSVDLPSGTGPLGKYRGGVDAFVASFSPTGALNYCTYLGGSARDQATGVAVDSSRNIYVVGWTTSTNFPVSNAVQPRLNGNRDAFVAKISPSGNSLIYSTFIGGSGIDSGNAIVVDGTGAATIVGDTTSTNLPVFNPIQPKLSGAQDVFVTRLNPAGNSLAFFTYLGGTGLDHANSVCLGISGAIFVGGYTWSIDFPTLLAFQAKSGGGQDGFLSKISPDGKNLKFSTYLGGRGGEPGSPETVNAVSVDSVGNILVAGITSSPDFPVTPGAFQTTFAGQTDGFIARFAMSGQLTQATFLGGSGTDQINGLALDFHGNPYVTGETNSEDFPVRDSLQLSNAGGMDAILAKLDGTLGQLVFGTYLGGIGDDDGLTVAVDSFTSIVVAGQTGSSNLETAGSTRSYSKAMISAFLMKISPSFALGVSYSYQSGQQFVEDPWHVSSYLSSTTYGNAGDVPVVGDWTGSGTKHIGVFRNGAWILDTNGNGILDVADKTVVFGQAGDIPVVGDWRGTGQIALGLFRQGTFILDLSGHLSGTPTGLSDVTFAFGQAGDLPIVADWNGSGTTKAGIFRNGLWLVDYNGDRVYNNLDQAYTYGQAGDIPVVGDWDSSGSPSKIGVYRAGLWILDYDGDHVWTTPYLNEMVIGLGYSGYTPLVF
jgi:hypothetical protein